MSTVNPATASTAPATASTTAIPPVPASTAGSSVPLEVGVALIFVILVGAFIFKKKATPVTTPVPTVTATPSVSPTPIPTETKHDDVDHEPPYVKPNSAIQ